MDPRSVPHAASDLLVTQEIRDGACVVQIHLDPRRTNEPFTALPHVRVLRGRPGQPPTSQTVQVSWKTADLLEAVLPLTSVETVLNTVEIQGHGPVTLPPVCLPTSPELAPDQPGRGEDALVRIAAATGGRARLEIPDIWRDLPARPRSHVLSPWLFLLAMTLFFLELVERRTGWLSLLLQGRLRSGVPTAEEPIPVPGPAMARPALPERLRQLVWRRAPARRSESAPTLADAAKISTAGPARVEPPVPTPPPPMDTMDALREARERARRRRGT